MQIFVQQKNILEKSTHYEKKWKNHAFTQKHVVIEERHGFYLFW